MARPNNVGANHSSIGGTSEVALSSVFNSPKRRRTDGPSTLAMYIRCHIAWIGEVQTKRSKTRGEHRWTTDVRYRYSTCCGLVPVASLIFSGMPSLARAKTGKGTRTAESV